MSDYERLRADVLALWDELRGEPPPPTPARATYLISNSLDAEHWTHVESEEEARGIAKENKWAQLFIDDAVKPDFSLALDAWDIKERIEEHAYDVYGGFVADDIRIDQPDEAEAKLKAFVNSWMDEYVSCGIEFACAGNPRELKL